MPEPVAGDDEARGPRRSAPGRCRARRGSGTARPRANAFGRDQTIPSERSPRSYQALEVGEVGRERLGALEVHDRRDPARLEVADPARDRDAEALEHGRLLLGDASRLLARDRVLERDRVRRGRRLERRRPATGRTARRTRRRSRPRPRGPGRCASASRRATAERRGRCARRGSRAASYGGRLRTDRLRRRASSGREPRGYARTDEHARPRRATRTPALARRPLARRRRPRHRFAPARDRARADRRVHGRRGGRRHPRRLARAALGRRAHAHRRRRAAALADRAPPRPAARGGQPHLRAAAHGDPLGAGERRDAARARRADRLRRDPAADHAAGPRRAA